MILACCAEGSPYYTVGGTLMILACCVEGSPYYTVGGTLMILACCVEGSPYYALCEYFPSSPSPQLPWSEFDNQFQIMFQLGNGKSPTIPEASLSSEGHDFLSHCFEQDPSRRWNANHLLDHPFVKVRVMWFVSW